MQLFKSNLENPTKHNYEQTFKLLKQNGRIFFTKNTIKFNFLNRLGFIFYIFGNI